MSTTGRAVVVDAQNVRPQFIGGKKFTVGKEVTVDRHLYAIAELAIAGKFKRGTSVEEALRFLEDRGNTQFLYNAGLPCPSAVLEQLQDYLLFYFKGEGSRQKTVTVDMDTIIDYVHQKESGLLIAQQPVCA